MRNPFSAHTHYQRQRHPLSTVRGDHLADSIMMMLGSWRCIVGQALLIGSWMVINILVSLLVHPYSILFSILNYILFILLFTFQALFIAPLILRSLQMHQHHLSVLLAGQIKLESTLALLLLMQQDRMQQTTLPVSAILPTPEPLIPASQQSGHISVSTALPTSVKRSSRRKKPVADSEHLSMPVVETESPSSSSSSSSSLSVS